MKKTKNSISSKNTPQRSCIACRSVKDKSELVRIVRLADSDILELDINGKKPGRGAYLCKNAECWKTGLKGNRLEHTLKLKLLTANKDALQAAATEIFSFDI